jgi:hypothetical protein
MKKLVLPSSLHIRTSNFAPRQVVNHMHSQMPISWLERVYLSLDTLYIIRVYKNNMLAFKMRNHNKQKIKFGDYEKGKNINPLINLEQWNFDFNIDRGTKAVSQFLKQWGFEYL